MSNKLKDEEIKENIPEPFELAIELFCDWYGINKPTLREFSNYTEYQFVEVWEKKWFAKKQQQVYMDSYLNKYKNLINIEAKVVFERRESELLFKISQLIAWDQIPRNIYRNTKEAYAYDKNARVLVEEVMTYWDILPIPIKITCILVYIHSEDIVDLSMVKTLLEKIQEGMRNYPVIMSALKGIAKNHSDRMTMFGRIPERNKYLNRQSTDTELAFLSVV